MPYKLTITIRYILIIIIALCLFALLYGAYENLNTVRKSTNQLDKGMDEVIVEWSSDYANDKAMMDKIDADLAEVQLRLEALGVNFE